MQGQVKPSIINWRFPRLVFLSFLFLTITLVFLVNSVQAAEVTLVWDPNTEQNIAGYRLHYGFETRKYTYSIEVGSETSYTITGLDLGKLIYFAATAYDIQGNESDYSEELLYIVPENLLPVADAGPDQTVLRGDMVTLDGSGSMDLDHGIDSFYWSQVGGPMVELLDPTKAQTTFFVPEDVEEGASLIFLLAVTDKAGFGSEDTCVVTVSNRTTYEDGEDCDGWTIYDNKPSGATISNVYDEDRDSWVIELWGSGTENGYRLRNEDGTKWGNSNQFTIEWSMKTLGDFRVYLDVETNTGHRYIYYSPADSDKLGLEKYVHHGLGSHVVDGKWRTFTRCLRADLNEAQPGVNIKEVNGFLIRGDCWVDDIRLMDCLPGETVYEDAEDGKISGWHVYDDDPLGAIISNVYDEDRQSRVIQLSGAGSENGYMLVNADGGSWCDQDLSVVEWSVKSADYFTIFFDVQTTAGQRFIEYASVDYDNLGNGTYVHHGIGWDATDGKWHTFTRDLQADLNEAQSGAMILEVNAFLIRGNCRVDDILLR